MTRKIKQLIYFSIFILFFSFPLIFFFWVKKITGTCYDGIQNQGEKGVDCGGPCPPCELKEKIVIQSLNYLINSDKTLDIVAKIENKEEALGLKNLRYQFLIYDLDNVLKDIINGETLLLPGELRYIVKLGYPIKDFTLGKVEFKILEPKSTDWIQISTSSIKISSYNEKVIFDNNKLKATLSLYNNSSVYYPKLEVIVFVYNQNQKLVTIGRTEVSLKPYESKDLIVSLGGGILSSEENLNLLKTEVIFQKLEE